MKYFSPAKAYACKDAHLLNDLQELMMGVGNGQYLYSEEDGAFSDPVSAEYVYDTLREFLNALVEIDLKDVHKEASCTDKNDPALVAAL